MAAAMEAAAPGGGCQLSHEAAAINDRLQVLDRLSGEALALLDVLSGTLGQLGVLTAPIHSRATALTCAARNIADAKGAVDALLEHLDTSRRVQPVLEAGPVRDLEGFLDGLAQLEASNDFLSQHSDLAAVRGAREHSQTVFNRALEACDGDFRTSLAAGNRSSSPPATWLASVRESFLAGADPHTTALTDLVPPALLPKLRRMVGLMLGAGYAPAQDGYVAARRRALTQVLHDAHLDLPPPPSAAAAAGGTGGSGGGGGGQLALLAPDQLERVMTAWGVQLTSLTLLLLSEQRLADEIWPQPLGRQLFCSLAQPLLAGLVGAARDVLEVRKAPDKLFALLEMHAALSRCLPLLSRMLATPPPPPLPPHALSPRQQALTRRPSSPGGSLSSVATGASGYFFSAGGGAGGGSPLRGARHGSSGLDSPLRGAGSSSILGAQGSQQQQRLAAQQQQQQQVQQQPQAPSVGDELLEQLAQLLRAMSGAAAALFGSYEEAVGRDGSSSKVLPADGTIHPLTAQVLSFLKRLLSNSSAARVLYGSSSSGAAATTTAAGRLRRGVSTSSSHRGPADSDYESSSSSEDDDRDGGAAGAAVRSGRPQRQSRATRALAQGVQRLLAKLLETLEAKARGYRSEPLAALFMMNNVHYVNWAVEGSPGAASLLGSEWLEGVKDVVEEWGAAYQAATWEPLVRLLQAELPQDPARLRLALKETYTAFNAAIDSIYTSQSGWTIPDHGLRGAVKRVIKDDLLGPYQDFLRRHADVEFTSHPARYIRYAASDVAALIDDDLFETKAAVGGSGRLNIQKEKLAW